MNWRAIWAIYKFEMARTKRTVTQSIVSPVLSTSLYFVVFGGAIAYLFQPVDLISSCNIVDLIAFSFLAQ